MSFTVIIPARYASSRLPAKPLAMIGDMPMIEHVYRRAKLSNASKVVVATDDQRIVELVKSFDGEVCLTKVGHQSGSDRLAEVCQQLALADDEIVINVQGDEPFISHRNIDQLAKNLTECDCPMATLSTPITEQEEVFNSNVVKVVADNNSRALYFSRAAIPWQRGQFEQQQVADLTACQRHIGIYGYRAGFLAKFVTMPAAKIEQLESLEQLRVLANGYSIHIAEAEEIPGIGIDTAEDLARAQEIYRQSRL